MMEKQERYLGENGEDWIDECARNMTPEQFRGAMEFTIGKYKRRLGKKDPVPQELRKMADYCLRWAEYEDGLISKSDSTSDENGWIRWSGGDCPLGPGIRADIKLRRGDVYYGIFATAVSWPHSMYDSDIVAYRVADDE